MKFITSLSVERTNRESSHFWPHGVNRLVVVVWQLDPRSDALLAFGIDPDHGHGYNHGRIVAEAEFPHALLSAFIKAVIDSNRGELERHCHRLAPPAADYHVGFDPKHLAHKASLALAAAIRSDVRLAEAVVNPSRPRRPPYRPDKNEGCE
jgi:hypothetical protein